MGQIDRTNYLFTPNQEDSSDKNVPKPLPMS
jgi:hypothetical protein